MTKLDVLIKEIETPYKLKSEDKYKEYCKAKKKLNDSILSLQEVIRNLDNDQINTLTLGQKWK